MYYVCPVCKKNNELSIDFSVEEYICDSCSSLIGREKNASRKIIKKPVENVVLKVGQKGTVYGTDYCVINIVVKKYGENIFWREYTLKDPSGNNVYLSESDGHWVLLRLLDSEFKDFKHYAETADGRKYRWYETTPCSIHSAAGFFEDKIDFKLAKYKEFVNGTEMISREECGNSVQFFKGDHISKYTIRKAFSLKELPYYSGVGIVEPFFFNVKQGINIIGISALLICLIQLYVVMSRTNQTIFEQEIKFADINDKELVSKSFSLSGASAPLEVNAYSDVDNSWANVGVSLVNEKTNEIAYTSKDIEKYSGYEGGESWSEGSQSEKFNFCGVAPGSYHFLISAEKEGGAADPFKSGYQLQNGEFSVIKNDLGIFYMRNNKDQSISQYTEKGILKNEISGINNLTEKPLEIKKLDSVLTNMSPQPGYPEKYEKNSSVKIKAAWQPVSFWNFAIVIIFSLIFIGASLLGRRIFEFSKWRNSSNSPYPTN
ncbi:DUF4178 domain-containing protein [Chryseobacterium luteum]|uniref:DUF4178 domain-containing protein n=1 Tax=Chryseobacterium luteum TaxID=421531 RepID=A0A085ZVC9_9FLAO|nr:DUF4178 domain-containing protein [Chryseobacterium luteum]KFF08393.1 hypothetical protein IX38_06410 [Chryseobacterium luteum]